MPESANRTCVFAGETFTSTAPGSAVRKRKSAGCRSVRIASREACPIARAIDRSSTGRPLTKRYWLRREAKVTEPRVANPETRRLPALPSNSTRSPSVSRPKTWRIRAARSTAAGASSTRRSFERTKNATEGFASAARVTAAAAARPSASGEERNFRRAGVRSKRPSTSTSVPRGRAAGSTRGASPCAIVTRMPSAVEPSDVVSAKRETEAIDGSASPRKP